MKNESIEKKKMGIFQWVLYAGIIPLAIVTSIVLIVLEISGFSVIDAAKNIPVIGTLVENKAQKDQVEEKQKQYEEQIQNFQEELENEKAMTAQLTSELESKEQEIDSLMLERERLEQQINELQDNQDEEEVTETETVTDLVLTYENMSPKNAAAILVEMDEETAVNILMQLDETILAGILEKMPADAAARFTLELTAE